MSKFKYNSKTKNRRKKSTIPIYILGIIVCIIILVFILI